MIAGPPLVAGVFQDTDALSRPAVAVTASGALGVVPTTIAAEAVDAVEVPTKVVAVTEKLYAVPSVSPVIVHESGPLDQAQVAPPGVAVTV